MKWILERKKMVEIYPSLKTFFSKCQNEFQLISDQRKESLQKLAIAISDSENKELVFLGLQSPLFQVVAQAAAAHYGLVGLTCFADGNESFSLQKQSVDALYSLGFKILPFKAEEIEEPGYEIYYSYNCPPLLVFTNRYDTSATPVLNYTTVITDASISEEVTSNSSNTILLPFPLMTSGNYEELVNTVGGEIAFGFHTAQQIMENDAE